MIKMMKNIKTQANQLKEIKDNAKFVERSLIRAIFANDLSLVNNQSPQ